MFASVASLPMNSTVTSSCSMASKSATVFASDLVDFTDFFAADFFVVLSWLPAVSSSLNKSGLANDSVNAIESKRVIFRFILKALIANSV